MIGSLGAVAYDIVANDKTGPGTKSAADQFAKASLAAGAAATAVGGAVVMLTGAARETNAELGVTALQLGVTTEEMRQLALETTNVTFPIEEVTGTFDILTRAGMRNTEQIAATATALDTLGDATGYSASRVAEHMIPALNAFDIPLEDAGDHIDTMTHLLRHTNIGLEDFGSTMRYITPDLDTLGIGLDDTAAMLEALSARGIEGSTATRMLRSAVTQADGDVTELYRALGLTTDEVSRYRDSIQGAEGMTQAFADAANEQFGVMDELKQSWEEWTLRVGSALMPLEGIGTGLATMGTIMMGAGSTVKLFSGIQLGTLVPSLYASAAAGWAAIAPWLPFIVAIGAVIGVLYILETRFGAVTAGIELLTSAGRAVVDWLTGTLTGALEDGGDSLLVFLGPIGGVIAAFRNWDEITEIISGIFDRVRGLIDDAIAWFSEAGSRIVSALIDGILSAPLTPFDAVKTLLGPVSRLLPHSPAEEGPLSELPDWGSYLVDPIREAGQGMEREAIASLQPVTGAISSRSETNHYGGDTFNVTINDRGDMDEFFRRYDQRMQARRVQRGIRL